MLLLYTLLMSFGSRIRTQTLKSEAVFCGKIYVTFEEGNGTPLQYSCLENPRDGGAWWAAVSGVAQSQTRLKRLSSSIRNIGLPQWLSGKESTCNTGDVASIPGSGRSPGGGHENRFLYSCLENPRDRGAWWATVYSITKSQK